MKYLLQSLFILLMVPVTAFSLLSPTNNIEIEGIVSNNANIQDYDKHHPFFGLFGAGFANPTDKNAAFTSYYDFCKDHGDGTAVDLGDFEQGSNQPIDGNPKHNFKLLVSELDVTALTVQNGDDEIEFTANEFQATELDTLFNAWKEAHKCDQYFNEEVSIFSKTYTIATENTQQITGKPYQRVEFDVGFDTKVRYLYCYDDNNLNKLDRDIALFLNQENTRNLLAIIRDDATNDRELLDKLLFNFLKVGNSEDLTTIVEANTSYYYLNIQGVTFPITPLSGDVVDTAYNDLITSSSIENSGLGHYCKEIRDMHTDAAQTNAGNIETCIKNHVSAVLAGNGAADGICSSEFCADRTISSTTVKGGLETVGTDEIYTFPEFGYCSNDIDRDGFITFDNRYNWGEFTAANMVPYTSVPDVCPQNEQSTTELPTWFQIGNPENTRESCSQPDGFVATAEAAREAGGDQANGGQTGGDQANGGQTGGDQANGRQTGGDQANRGQTAGGQAAGGRQTPTPTFDFSTTVTNGSVVVSRNVEVANQLAQLTLRNSNDVITVDARRSDDAAATFIHGATPVLTRAVTNGAVTQYCVKLKPNQTNLAQEYLLIIPATGTNQGVITTTKVIDDEPLTVQAIQLNDDGSVVNGAQLVQRNENLPCSFETVQR